MEHLAVNHGNYDHDRAGDTTPKLYHKSLTSRDEIEAGERDDIAKASHLDSQCLATPGTSSFSGVLAGFEIETEFAKMMSLRLLTKNLMSKSANPLKEIHRKSDIIGFYLDETMCFCP